MERVEHGIQRDVFVFRHTFGQRLGKHQRPAARYDVGRVR